VKKTAAPHQGGFSFSGGALVRGGGL